MLKILVVDDEQDIRELISDVLQHDRYEILTADNGIAAIEIASKHILQLVILDIWLRDSKIDGLQVLEILSKRYPALPVIMISGHGNIATAVKSIKMGAYDYIEKPFETDKLRLLVNRALESADLRRENAELRDLSPQNCDEALVGNSFAIRNIKAIISRVAPTTSRVLIFGESGTGKSLVARLIHQNSQNPAARFVVFRASCFAKERLEEELFGLETKDFLNRKPIKIGAVEKAHNGTLFIDEIAALSHNAQNSLLRFLQEKKFCRVGGTNEISCEVRLLSATCKNLYTEIDCNNFRRDLFYRLNVISIHIPSLAQRSDDIKELCTYLIEKICIQSSLMPCTLTDEILSIMQTYNWPGNIQELRNVLERLVILGQSCRITPSMLPPEIFPNTPSFDNSNVIAMPLKDAREEFEKRYIKAQLNRFGGNISKTARFIQMERSALHRKLKLLKISDSINE